jgi:hypothetical protein
MLHNGEAGVQYSCGHFVAGPAGGEPGKPRERVTDAFKRIAPCPKCYPAGATAHARFVDSIQSTFSTAVTNAQ